MHCGYCVYGEVGLHQVAEKGHAMDAIVTLPQIEQPTPEDATAAAVAGDILLGSGDGELHLRLDDGKRVTLPRVAARLLRDMLAEMARGCCCSDADAYGIHHAASGRLSGDVAAVSDWAAGERDESRHKVGTHRRVRFSELDAYRKRSRAKSDAAMDELVAQAQELGLGY